jgi:ribosome-associated toxin RatA of RatAB toxin-antitoxin module
MNNKEVEKIVCTVCESNYKLVYEIEETSGYSKFCPFCSSEINIEQTYDDDTTNSDE